MLPQPWRALVELTPLQYLAYFPAAVLLGKVQGATLVRGLVIETVWVVVFIVLSRILFYEINANDLIRVEIVNALVALYLPIKTGLSVRPDDHRFNVELRPNLFLPLIT